MLKSESLESVHSLIKAMKAEGVSMSLKTLTILANKYSDEGLFFNIEHILGYMEEFGMEPDSEFIQALVRAYGVGANTAGVERVVEFGVKHGVKVDGEMKNLLLDYYASVDNREKVEELMTELWAEGKDGSGPQEESLPVFVKPYLEVMKMFCRLEDFDAAEKMFWEMLSKHQLQLDVPSFNLIMRSRMDAGDRLGARKMIAKYGEFKKLDCEVGNAELFRGDDVTYNLFVQFLASEYDQLNLTDMLEHMEEMAFELHPDSFPAVLKSSAVSGDERKVEELWKWFEKQKWPGRETLKRDSFHIGMSELLMQKKFDFFFSLFFSFLFFSFLFFSFLFFPFLFSFLSFFLFFSFLFSFLLFSFLLFISSYSSFLLFLLPGVTNPKKPSNKWTKKVTTLPVSPTV